MPRIGKPNAVERLAEQLARSRAPARIGIGQRTPDDLRDRILSGGLAAGDKLPSESDVMRDYHMSRTVAKMAINVLRSEGLITSHPGKGSFVRTARQVRRLGNDRYQRRSDASPPFASDAKAAGQSARWDHHSREERASAVVAERLAIEPGDAVMVTDYRLFADDEPMQLSISYEPLAITRGTPSSCLRTATCSV